MSELSGSTQLRNVVESVSPGLIERSRDERSVGKKKIKEMWTSGYDLPFFFFFFFLESMIVSCAEWLAWESSTGLMRSDLPRPDQQHAAKWRKQLLNASLTSKFTAHSKHERTNLGEQYRRKAQVWLSRAAKKSKKKSVGIPLLQVILPKEGEKNISGIVVGGKNDLELGEPWMFSQKSNVIFVQYHLDYCKSKKKKQKKLSFACTQFLSRKVKQLKS